MKDEYDRYFRLRNKSAPWGDYGNILVSGMTSHLERHEGMLQLERTGPFQPNAILSGSGDLLITSGLKEEMHTAFPRLTFRQVIKKHIVFLDWTSWDLKADDPPMYPEGGEPGNYILELPHSESLAKGMEDVWEIVIPESGTSPDCKSFKPDPGTDYDIVYPKARYCIFVSERMKDWLVANETKWLDFQ